MGIVWDDYSIWEDWVVVQEWIMRCIPELWGGYIKQNNQFIYAHKISVSPTNLYTVSVFMYQKK